MFELTPGNKADYLYCFWVRINKTLTSTEIMHTFEYSLFPTLPQYNALFISLQVTLEWNVLSSEAMKYIIKCHMLTLAVMDATPWFQQRCPYSDQSCNLVPWNIKKKCLINNCIKRESNLKIKFKCEGKIKDKVPVNLSVIPLNKDVNFLKN